MAESNEINNTIYDAVSNALENKINNCNTLLPSTTGKSAYDLAVDYGYVGTESMWLDTLQGLSAYEVAVSNGYIGSKTEWLSSIKGDSAYEIAVKNGYEGTQAEWTATSWVVSKGTVRPAMTSKTTGVMFFDTSLAAAGKPIWWTGSEWVDALGVAV